MILGTEGGGVRDASQILQAYGNWAREAVSGKGFSKLPCMGN